MRINWFSPLPPARTDIANFSARVLPALAERADVQPFAVNADPAPLAAGLRPQPIGNGRLPWTEVNFREHSIYQIGNDDRFHGPILDLLARHSGIVVLHDGNLHETQRMRFVERERNPAAYLAELAAEGGDDAIAVGRGVLDGTVSLEDAAARYPLTRRLLRGAQGVITHNPAQLAPLAAQTSAPCIYLPLAYEDPAQWPTVLPRSLGPGEPLRMVLFGFLHGHNRRFHPILEAWSRFPQRERLHLTVFGEYDRAAIVATLDRLGLTAQVELHPFLDEAEVTRILQRSHLALNLRYPTRGEASGTLLRTWSHALPTVVTHTDYYAHLDPSTVTRIRPEHEEADLHHHWAGFLDDPATYFAQGKAGRARLLRDHTPAAYVDGLLAFLNTVATARPAAYLERWLPTLAQEHLAALPYPAAQQHWKTRLAAEVTTWFP